MGLTALDIIVLLLVGGGAVWGAWRGFVTEVLSLFTWLLIVFALRVLQAPLTALLTGSVGTSAGAAVLAFALIAGSAYFGGHALARSIGQRTRTSVVGPVDRALGFGFGGLKGMIFASLLFLLLVLLVDIVSGGPARRPGWITESRSYPLLRVTSAGIADFVDRRRRGDSWFGGNSSAPAEGNGNGSRAL